MKIGAETVTVNAMSETMNANSNVADARGEGMMIMPSKLSAETVEELYNQMKAARLDSMGHVTLDFSDVDICTSPGVQLMVSLERSLLEAGGALKLIHLKPSVSAVLRDLGFERFLQVKS